MRVFISYRRDDLAARSIVGRIHERLSKRFGTTNVFVDEHAVPPGTDFRDFVQRQLASCDVVFALIGPQWADLMQSRQDGNEDHLRFELETALKSGRQIVPILLSGARMPNEAALPPSIGRLAYLNARSIDPGPDFNYQFDRLIADLEGSSSRSRHTSALTIAGVLGALAVLAIGAVAYYLNLSQKPPSTAPQTLSVLVVMGENVDYEKSIRDGFIRHLENELPRRNVKLVVRREVVPRFKDTYASPKSEAGKAAWDDVVADIRGTYKKGMIDYFVTLGTFASIAIRDSNLIHELEAKGLIFLGVTDPTRAGLVGKPKITGVRYGTGGIDYGRKVAELFSDNQKLVFIYQSGKDNIQDIAVADDLTTLNQTYATTHPMARRPRFDIRPLDKQIEIKDLADGNPADPANSDIYFAWYGLDNVLAAPNAALSNTKLWIIPSTYSERTFRTAGLIVSVDDGLVGRFGAEIVLKQVDEPSLSLDQLPVRAPGFKVWINEERVREKGIKLAEAAWHRKAAKDPTYSFALPGQ
ncbi:MAG: hypothetical protein C0511_18730 [Hyphomicrobium sp.]|nr:hypothetical protein [Hyphomicrobium sp.]PPC79606.1 MAG: hypothetical protein CTY40_10740 [Hyphomicrobium sp.]